MASPKAILEAVCRPIVKLPFMRYFAKENAQRMRSLGEFCLGQRVSVGVLRCL